MKNFILCLFAMATIVACQTKSTTSTTVTDATTTVTPPPPPPPPAPETSTTTCYEKREGKDLSAVELTIANNAVSGYYAWEPHEKDGAHGFFSGTKTGDEITAIYTYMIEGSIQTEEIMFKLENGKLIKARAELKDPKDDGNLVIKDKSKVKWSETYAPVDAAKVAGTIKNSKETYAMIQKMQTIEQSKKKK
jgi:hypothetical protein